MSSNEPRWDANWTNDDRADIKSAMDRQFAAMPNKGWQRIVDPAVVYATVVSATAFQSVLFHGYLLSFRMHTPWYAPAGTFVLEETLLLKVDPAAHNIRPVIRMMEHIARVEGCIGIAVGTALNAIDEKLVRVYRRFGFRIEAHALYKELQ